MRTKLTFIILFILIVAAAFAGGEAWREHRIAQQQIKTNAKAPTADITIIEGWNNSDVAALLENKNIIPAKDFLNLEKSFDVSAYPLLASKPASADLEGFLFPDTYQIFAPTTNLSQATAANAAIKKMLDNFSLKFTPEMAVQAKEDNMSVYQIITLASIIEKETGHSQSDRNTVAGIFYNRLKAGIALQSDATVSFFTGRADVTTDDTKIDSPYNTFLYPGLPKGPICNPSLSSIMAALYPTKTDYLYFLTDPKTGQVYYAITYDQHLLNKARYLR